MTCDHCGRQVPEGAFCTNCGAHQGVGVDSPQTRTRQFAAHPGEHVAHPSVFTTLFPHASHGKVHEFRYAFLAGLVIVVLLVATGLVVAALLAAIFLVPVLYLIYMYEAQVYRNEPALVLGITFAGGIILGLVITIIADHVIGGGSPGAGDPTLLGYSLILPIIQLIVIPIPALALRGRQPFVETIDGLTFGVAAGLGFSVAEGIVRFSGVIGALGVRTSPGGWIYPLISLAALVPLLHGSTGGAIAAALWRQHRGNSGRIAAIGIPVALVACVAFYLIAQLLADAGLAPLIVLLYQLLPIGLLLLYIRFLVHHSQLEEGRDLGFQPTVCPHCHQHVMAAGFCPSCGVALAAAPRTAALAAPAAAGSVGTTAQGA